MLYICRKKDYRGKHIVVVEDAEAIVQGRNEIMWRKSAES